MGQNTKIEWCHHTFNPWWGCTKVSPACGLPIKGHEGEEHGCCYADTFSNRLGFKIWGQDAPRRFFKESHWDDLWKWNAAAEKAGKPETVFCGSMCDIMEDRRDLDMFRDFTFKIAEKTKWLTYMFLTKRPQNFRRLLPSHWIENPLPNVWLMTTVEASDYLWRIDALKSAPAVVHGLSIEPLLGPMPTLGEYLDGIDFAIVGGESGHGARPMHQHWPRQILQQCLNAGCKFFFKQWGDWQDGSGLSDKAHVVLNDGRHKLAGSPDWDRETLNQWPHYYPRLMLRVGKGKAGRILEDREWNEMPEVRNG